MKPRIFTKPKPCYRRASHPFLFFVTLIIVSLFSSTVLDRTILATVSSTAKNLYQDAAARLNQMQRSPDKYSYGNWRNLASSFRAVYYRFPTSGYADDAVYHEAEIFRLMYNRTQHVEYWQLAITRFKFLLQEYPFSRLGVQAYLQVAELYRVRGLDEWRSYVQQCPHKFPQSCARAPLYTELKKALDEERTRTKKSLSSIPSNLKSLEEIRVFPSMSYTRVVFYLTDAVSYRPGVLRNPDRLYFDLDNTRLSEQIKQQTWQFASTNSIKNVRVGQFLPDTARVVLDFDRIKRHRMFTLENPFRIVIDVFQEDWQPAGTLTARSTPKPEPSVSSEKSVTPPEPSTPVPKTNRNGTYSLYRQMGMKARRIMLDPGHGGHDPGAIGVDGVKEKDVTLDIALRLKKQIENRWDVVVLMTREDDRFIPLEERTALANSQGVDLFVSIHANASRHSSVRGIETYYLHWAKNEHDMEVAARENAITTAKMHELKKFVKMILQNPKMEESHDLAMYVQKLLVQRVQSKYNTKDLGVKTAPFYVLMGAEMPAILIEISFITHPTEGRLLKHDEYRSNIVDGILQGLEQYLEAQGSLSLLAK